METKPLLEKFTEEMRALESEEPIPLDIDRLAIVTIISQIQLALRHPGNNGQSAEDAKEICRQLQTAFEPDSAIAQVIEIGWNPLFDMARQNNG